MSHHYIQKIFIFLKRGLHDEPEETAVDILTMANTDLSKIANMVSSDADLNEFLQKKPKKPKQRYNYFIYSCRSNREATFYI